MITPEPSETERAALLEALSGASEPEAAAESPWRRAALLEGIDVLQP